MTDFDDNDENNEDDDRNYNNKVMCLDGMCE